MSHLFYRTIFGGCWSLGRFSDSKSNLESDVEIQFLISYFLSWKWETNLFRKKIDLYKFIYFVFLSLWIRCVLWTSFCFFFAEYLLFPDEPHLYFPAITDLPVYAAHLPSASSGAVSWKWAALLLLRERPSSDPYSLVKKTQAEFVEAVIWLSLPLFEDPIQAHTKLNWQDKRFLFLQKPFPDFEAGFPVLKLRTLPDGFLGSCQKPLTLALVLCNWDSTRKQQKVLKAIHLKPPSDRFLERTASVDHLQSHFFIQLQVGFLPDEFYCCLSISFFWFGRDRKRLEIDSNRLYSIFGSLPEDNGFKLRSSRNALNKTFSFSVFIFPLSELPDIPVFPLVRLNFFE